MIDGVFAGIPMFLLPLIPTISPGLAGIWSVLGIAWAIFYLFFADGLHGGQSFAKQWLGTRVVDAKTGEPCTWGRSFIRNIFTLLGPIDWIFIFGEKHQRLGDKAAGTIVIVAD
jgi:uncharacterized RDD family membrane protein YckC